MRLLARCLSALLLFLGSTGYAADYSATGTVNILRTRGFLPGVESDSLSLAGVDSLGTCKPDEAGHVVLLLPHGKGGERMFELALASKTSGTPLTIWTNDTVTAASGFCFVSYIE